MVLRYIVWVMWINLPRMNTNPPLADQLYGFHWIMWNISESLKNNEDAENAEKISAISPPAGGSV